METIFPTDDGIAGLFFVGWHRSAGGTITRTGTVVVKRSYVVAPDSVDPANGSLAPVAEAQPVFLLDQPEGPLVENGDFEAGTDGWTPDAGVALAQQVDLDGENHLLAVSGPINGGVRQVIDLQAALAGRAFVLSMKAKADAATAIAGVQLEAAGLARCVITTNLTTAWQSCSASGTWPNDVANTKVSLVLRSAANAGRSVHYDDVTLIHVTYEHDLAADKPGADTIVLPSLHFVPAELQVDGATWLRRPAGEATLLRTFGWERRDVDPRKADAAFPEDEDAYPLPQPLPSAFNNRFYNGYRRPPRNEVNTNVPPYLAPASLLRLRRTGASDYGFRLGSEMFSARYQYYSGIGPDTEARWQPRDVPMRLDTLVLEPDDNRCYAVWRGVWEFDERAEDNYRRLSVSLTA